MRIKHAFQIINWSAAAIAVAVLVIGKEQYYPWIAVAVLAAVSLHLLIEARGIPALVLEEVRAHLGGDREAGRDREPQIGVSGHLSQVGPFAPEEVLHLLFSVRPSAAEEIDELRCAHT